VNQKSWVRIPTEKRFLLSNTFVPYVTYGRHQEYKSVYLFSISAVFRYLVNSRCLWVPWNPAKRKSSWPRELSRVCHIKFGRWLTSLGHSHYCAYLHFLRLCFGWASLTTSEVSRTFNRIMNRQLINRGTMCKYLGPMLWFFKYFRRKILRKYWRFLLNLLLVFAKKIDHSIGFWEKRHFFAENWQKLQKIVIITSTPVWIKYVILMYQREYYVYKIWLPFHLLKNVKVI
jgi:hypothetical protein